MINPAIIILLVSLASFLGGLFALGFLRGFKHFKKSMLFVVLLLIILTVIQILKEIIDISLGSFFLVTAGLVTMLAIHYMKKGKEGTFDVPHAVIEGLAVGASFVIAPDLGIVVAILIGLHNIPEGGLTALPFFIKKKKASGFQRIASHESAFLLAALGWP